MAADEATTKATTSRAIDLSPKALLKSLLSLQDAPGLGWCLERVARIIRPQAAKLEGLTDQDKKIIYTVTALAPRTGKLSAAEREDLLRCGALANVDIEHTPENSLILATHYLALAAADPSRGTKEDPYWGRALMYAAQASAMSLGEVMANMFSADVAE